MTLSISNSKVGVYVDAANIYRSGGSGMQYDILREFATRDGGEPLRLNAYVTYDNQRAQTDYDYRKKAFGFHNKLRDFGYKVILKHVKWYEDESGNRYAKANADLDLAVDALLQSESLDRLLIATGDGDFVQVVRALQNRGLRVEIIAFDNVSPQLRQEADLFMSGFLVPGLLVTNERELPWGEVGSTVRGWCYYYDEERGIGFMRFLKAVASGLWVVDTRHEDSPYQTAFFHHSQLPNEWVKQQLPSRDHIFQFKLTQSERHPDQLTAEDIELVNKL